MNKKCFFKALEHFLTHYKPSKENLTLVLIDTELAHVLTTVVEFARQPSIIRVTFPTDGSHKLQPLDVTVYGSFKIRLSLMTGCCPTLKKTVIY